LIDWKKIIITNYVQNFYCYLQTALKGAGFQSTEVKIYENQLCFLLLMNNKKVIFFLIWLTRFTGSQYSHQKPHILNGEEEGKASCYADSCRNGWSSKNWLIITTIIIDVQLSKLKVSIETLCRLFDWCPTKCQFLDETFSLDGCTLTVMVIHLFL